MSGKAGYKGKVKINDTVIGGSTTWSYSGDQRQMGEVSELGDEIQTDIPLQVVGGEVTISGNYLMDTDAGQALLKTLYDAGTAITNLKLYIDLDDSVYMDPDSTTTPASYATVTSYNNVTNEKSGVGQFTATLKISGKLVPKGATSTVQVETTGAHSLAATTAELVGNLISIGGESSVECYFEYGETISYGSTTYATADTLTAAGLFGAALTGLTSATTYHYRSVVKYGSSYAYGVDKTFTTT